MKANIRRKDNQMAHNREAKKKFKNEVLACKKFPRNDYHQIIYLRKYKKAISR